MRRFDPYLPIIGVVGLIIVWYLAVWYQVVDPVLLPSPVVDRDDRWPARLRFHAHAGAHDFRNADRGCDCDPARHSPGRVREGLPLGRVRRRFLPFHPGLRHVPAVPGAVRGRRQDQDFGRRIRGGAGHPVQRRLWGDARAQDAALGRQGDGRVANPRAHRRHAARIAAADLRRIAQWRLAGAGHRGRRRARMSLLPWAYT